MDRLAELAEYDRSIKGLIDDDFLAAGFTPDEIASYRGGFTPQALTPQDITQAEERFGTLQAPDLTMRETATQRVQDALINQVGLDPYLAGRYARDIMGDTSPTSQNILDGLGLADLTPLGAVFGVEEGAGTAVEGYEQGDPLKMGLGVAEAGLGVAEAFPLTRPIAEGAGVLAREVYSSPYMADAIGTLRGIRDLDADFLLGRGDPAMAQGVGADVVGGPAKSIDDQIAELDIEVAALRQNVLDNPTDAAAFDEYKSVQRMRNDLKDQRAVSRAEGRDLSQAVEEPARTATEDEGFEAYLETVNPGGKRVAAEDRPNLAMGDMYGMLPRNSEVVGSQGDTTFYRGSDGNYYATAFNPDVGEEDVVGYITDRGDSTELAVVEELQGQGIGGELQYLFRKENPDAPTGGLTEAGEASLRKTYQRLADEGVVDGGVPFGGASAPDIPEAPALPDPRNNAEAAAKEVLELRAAGRANEVTEEMMAAADDQYMYFNTPLPMDEASRMARAREMGFDVAKPRYHGSDLSLPYLDPDMGAGERYRTGVFSTDNPDVADSYVSKSGGTIYPMATRRNDGGSTINAAGANWNKIPPSAPARIAGSALEQEFPELFGDVSTTAYDVAPSIYDDLFNSGASTNALAREKRFAGDSNITFENLVDRGPNIKRYLGETPEMQKARELSASQPSEVRVDFYGNQIRAPFARFDPEFRNLKNLSAGVGGAAVLIALADDAEAGTPEQQISELVREAGFDGAAQILGVSPLDIEEAISIAVPQGQWDQLVVGQ